MIRWTASVCLAVAMSNSGGVAPAQDAKGAATGSQPASIPPKSDKSAAASLDDLLAQALKNNPDIRVAEAKLREAEAELNRTRLMVTQKIVVTQNAIDIQKGIVEHSDGKLRSGLPATPSERSSAQQRIAESKAKLSELEAELAFLTGKPSPTKAASGSQAHAVDFLHWHYLQGLNRPASNLVLEPTLFPSTVNTPYRVSLPFPPAPAAPGSATDKLRKALDTQVEVKFENAELHEVLEFLETSAPGLSFRILDPNHKDAAVTLKIKAPVPIGAVLQALEDGFSKDSTGLRFVVRDYGILVTLADRVPPGALLVERLWKTDQSSTSPKGGDADKTKK